MTSFALRRELSADFDETLARLPEALRAEGFGILTEVDVQETLRRKLGVDFRRYRILGACNPPLAHRMLEAVPEIGLLLPCNVVVYEDHAGHTVVAAVDPTAQPAARENDEVMEGAQAVRDKLARVINGL